MIITKKILALMANCAKLANLAIVMPKNDNISSARDKSYVTPFQGHNYAESSAKGDKTSSNRPAGAFNQAARVSQTLSPSPRPFEKQVIDTFEEHEEHIMALGYTPVTGAAGGLTSADLWIVVEEGMEEMEQIASSLTDANSGIWGASAAIDAAVSGYHAYQEYQGKKEFKKNHPVMSTDAEHRAIEQEFISQECRKFDKNIALNIYEAATSGLQSSLYPLELAAAGTTTGVGPLMMAAGAMGMGTGIVQDQKSSKVLKQVEKTEENHPIVKYHTDSVRISRKRARQMIPELQKRNYENKVNRAFENILSGGISVITGAGFLTLAVVSATAPLTGGLTVILVTVAVVPAVAFGAKHLKAKRKLAKAEKALQAKLMEAEQKAQNLDRKIQNLSQKMKSARQELKQIKGQLQLATSDFHKEKLAAQMKQIKAKIADYSNQGHTLQLEYDQAAAEIQRCSMENFLTHTDEVVEESLNDLCYPDKPHHADQIKEILSHYCVAQYKGKFDEAKFNATCSLMQKLWTSNDPKSRSNAKLIYRKLLGLPQQNFVPLSSEARDALLKNLSFQQVLAQANEAKKTVAKNSSPLPQDSLLDQAFREAQEYIF